MSEKKRDPRIDPKPGDVRCARACVWCGNELLPLDSEACSPKCQKILEDLAALDQEF